jgi:hypothetical protein
MKNTIRARQENKPEPKAPQGRKPTIHGQNTATIGHEQFDTKGKVTIGALRIGEALDLSENEIKALALLADWEDRTPGEYCKVAIMSYMETSVDQVVIEVRDGKEEKERAAKVLSDLPQIFRQHATDRPLHAVSPGTISQTLADDAKAALAELDRAGAAVASLLMMVADNFGENMGGYSPDDKTGAWEKFAKFEVLAAPLDLAINQIIRFRAELDLWRKEQFSMIECVTWNSRELLEIELLQLNALLLLQANAFDRQYRIADGTSPCLLAQSVADRLWSAYNKSLHFYSALRRAVETSRLNPNLRRPAIAGWRKPKRFYEFKKSSLKSSSRKTGL